MKEKCNSATLSRLHVRVSLRRAAYTGANQLALLLLTISGSPPGYVYVQAEAT